MPLRIRQKNTLRVSASTAEVRNYFDNLEDPDAEVILDDLLHEHDGTLSIAAAANENLPAGDIAAGGIRYVRIDCNRTFRISIDGGPQLIIEARTTSKGVLRAFFEAYLAPTTSINIANPDATNVLDGEFVICGDVVP